MLTRKFVVLISFFVCLFISGCTSGPEETIINTANALKEKDSIKFASYVDIKSYSEHAMIDEKTAYHKAANVFFGSSQTQQIMTFVEAMIPQAQIDASVEGIKQLVATGQLPLLCKQSNKPDCPWEYEALNKASITETGPNSAIASVDTSNGIRQWVAIRKYDDNWKIMAVSANKSDAEYKASDQRQASIKEAKEKERIQEVKKFEEYEVNLALYNDMIKSEKEKKDASKKESQQLLNNIAISDLKCSVRAEPKPNTFSSKPQYLYDISCIINNKNPHIAKDCAIKINIIDNDVIVESFSFQTGYNESFESQQKYAKNWKIWAPKLNDFTAQKINDGTLTTSASVVSMRYNGEQVTPDHIGYPNITIPSSPPRKPSGYDEWKNGKK